LLEGSTDKEGVSDGFTDVLGIRERLGCNEILGDSLGVELGCVEMDGAIEGSRDRLGTNDILGSCEGCCDIDGDAEGDEDGDADGVEDGDIGDELGLSVGAGKQTVVELYVI